MITVSAMMMLIGVSSTSATLRQNLPDLGCPVSTPNPPSCRRDALGFPPKRGGLLLGRGRLVGG
jgi:hypothetical protein